MTLAPHRPAFRALALVLATALASGCATYTAVRPGAVEPGQEVRVTLDPDAPPELTEFVSGARGAVLVGTVTDRDADALMVAVASAVREQGLRSEVFRQRVRIPESEIVGLELRRIDRPRTAIVLVLGAAAVVTTLALILSGDAGGAVEGLPTPPPQLLPRP